jgi:hypothetical protein
MKPVTTGDEYEVSFLDWKNVPRGLDGFSAWPIQAGDVHPPARLNERQDLKPTYLEANRMSPQGLGALFRLGAPKPGHPSSNGNWPRRPFAAISDGVANRPDQPFDG